MPDADITTLLHRVSQGDSTAQQDLISQIYSELRSLAGALMRRERGDHTLQATALVNEAWLRLTKSTTVQWADRAHFFAVSAQIMRRILIDLADRRSASKRGGQAVRIEFDENIALSDTQSDELQALENALQRLEASTPRLAKVVEMRYYAGMTEDEIASVLGVDSRTVRRDWAKARASLHRDLTNGSNSVSSSRAASR